MWLTVRRCFPSLSVPFHPTLLPPGLRESVETSDPDSSRLPFMIPI